ncbi:MAG: hypothetical protein Kow0069_09050 [Promethearchaeota archaeon]
MEGRFQHSRGVLWCYGVGLATFLFWASCLAFLGAFNAWTAFGPVLVVDALVPAKWYFRSPATFKTALSATWRRVLTALKKGGTVDLALLSLVFSLQYLLQVGVAGSDVALPSHDPYYWLQKAWHLHETGGLDPGDPSNWDPHTPGFVVFCASHAAFSSDVWVSYWVLKYSPLFLLWIVLLATYCMGMRTFRSRLSAFVCCAFVLGSRYLVTRFVLPVASNLAVAFAFLYVLSFLGNEGAREGGRKLPLSREKITGGLTLFSVWFAHPLYGAYFTGLALSFTVASGAYGKLVGVAGGRGRLWSSVRNAAIQAATIAVLLVPYAIWTNSKLGFLPYLQKLPYLILAGATLENSRLLPLSLAEAAVRMAEFVYRWGIKLYSSVPSTRPIPSRRAWPTPS